MVLLTREELQALRSRESDKSIKNNIVVQEDIKFSGEMRGGYLHADTLKKAEESKKRTHRLCQIGGAVESVLGAPIEEEDIPKLIGFLKRQEANGKFFSKAMQKEVNTDMEEV